MILFISDSFGPLSKHRMNIPISKAEKCKQLKIIGWPANPTSPVENLNDLELDFKVFSLLILVVQTLYLMNPTDATLALLSVLKY